MLEVKELSVEIAGVQVLRELGFSLRAGVCTVLIGRNGAGKTTTLRAIMGLLPRQKGSIYLDGKPVHDLPSHARAELGIGYSPEDRRLIGEFSIEDNILLPALALNMSAGERKRRLEEVWGWSY